VSHALELDRCILLHTKDSMAALTGRESEVIMKTLWGCLLVKPDPKALKPRDREAGLRSGKPLWPSTLHFLLILL